jgi:hypothetical protein
LQSPFPPDGLTYLHLRQAFTDLASAPPAPGPRPLRP